MKVLEVNGHSGSRHGDSKKSENVAFFMSVQELWKGSKYADRCLEWSLEAEH